MAKKKITDEVRLTWQRHNNADATIDRLQHWTFEKQNYFLSRLDWIEKSLDNGNHEAYRIAFNQLKTALQQHKQTLDKVHELLIYKE